MVANSPGLIAGSNVLHRLLMPRHPPCALHSLSQQRQNNTRRNKHKRLDQPTPQSKGRAGLHTFDATSQEPASHAYHFHNHQPLQDTSRKTHLERSRGCEDARVHYADLKQQPHQHPTPTTSKPAHVRCRAKGGHQSTNHTPQTRGQPPGGDVRLILQDPTVCLTPSPTNAGP